jgi:hypothetical protein
MRRRLWRRVRNAWLLRLKKEMSALALVDALIDKSACKQRNQGSCDSPSIIPSSILSILVNRKGNVGVSSAGMQ